MKEKIRKLLKVIAMILASIIGSFIATIATLRVWLGFTPPSEVCFIQTEEGGCLTIFSLAPSLWQAIIGGTLFILIAIGIYRGIKEKFD